MQKTSALANEGLAPATFSKHNSGHAQGGAKRATCDIGKPESRSVCRLISADGLNGLRAIVVAWPERVRLLQGRVTTATPAMNAGLHKGPTSGPSEGWVRTMLTDSGSKYYIMERAVQGRWSGAIRKPASRWRPFGWRLKNTSMLNRQHSLMMLRLAHQPRLGQICAKNSGKLEAPSAPQPLSSWQISLSRLWHRLQNTQAVPSQVARPAPAGPSATGSKRQGACRRAPPRSGLRPIAASCQTLQH